MCKLAPLNCVELLSFIDFTSSSSSSHCHCIKVEKRGGWGTNVLTRCNVFCHFELIQAQVYMFSKYNVHIFDGSLFYPRHFQIAKKYPSPFQLALFLPSNFLSPPSKLLSLPSSRPAISDPFVVMPPLLLSFFSHRTKEDRSWIMIRVKPRFLLD